MKNALRLYRNIALALTAASLVVAPALSAPDRFDGVRLAQNERTRDQDRAFRATRDGRSMPLPMIERRVMPFMGGADYLGPEFKGGTYRLKFMDNGHVIWVDVDAATGRIVRRSGN